MDNTIAPKKTRKKLNFTLLQAIESVAERSRDSKLSPDFMKASAAEIKFLAEQYGISERQAVLFAVCMDEGPHFALQRGRCHHRHPQGRCRKR